mmetsp:Transcript_3790/g.8250  ORF Transcript_3790/g.8250 Transcript_3790/m.8250 type:complete len:2650 (-) Transcript_3790:57-8006(-)|eukprot:CAMPEP_0178548300 /NCGR_PEP_ID=MMETSP0697-20121206/5126_1 /TAXON_ID=265572 /ORGANISM="Extubocellulus spinifer, Strain CCMP396" /LENGTH=2649 /DNA_ID=CAMNT_0020180973 /DNA_START=322 /DNA_END=8271 /DNA_ORIENTATION=+
MTPGPIEFVLPPPSSSTRASDAAAVPHLILYCLPHAGGSPSSFREWQQHVIDLHVQIRVLSLPGRAGRFNETPWDDWDHATEDGEDDADDSPSPVAATLAAATATATTASSRGKFVSALTQAFLSDWDGMTPYAFFGHSFGTLLSYELILQLEHLQIRPLPLLNIISAHRAPGISPELGGVAQSHTLPRRNFVDMIRNWGLVPGDALENDELVDIMVPALRADLKLDETHVPCSCGGKSIMKTRVPMILYGGTHDKTVPCHQLTAWKELALPPSSSSHTTSSQSMMCDEVWFDGDHFYTVTHLTELMADLRKRLQTALSGVERSILVGGECGASSLPSLSNLDNDCCLVEECALQPCEEENLDYDNDVDDYEALNVLDLFFLQVRRTPNFLAMVDESGNEWTYTEVQNSVVKLGEHLISVTDVGEDKARDVGACRSDGSESAVSAAHTKESPRVGIFLRHSSAYLLANLSSWYAGCSVVLLERNWTGTLLCEFVAVCKVDVIITDSAGVDALEVSGVVSLDINEKGAVTIVEEEKKDAAETAKAVNSVPDRRCPHVIVLPSESLSELKSAAPNSMTNGQKVMKLNEVAFVSMTSGSTGKPSAVLTTHLGTRFCFEGRYKLYPYRTKAEDLQEREGANVFFAWESIRPLLRGHVVVVIPDDVMISPPHFTNFVNKNKITRLVVTPSLLDSVFTYPHLGETLNEKLKHMYACFLMGEVVPMRLLERAEMFLPKDMQLVNAYSSWEALDTSYSNLLPLNQHQIRLSSMDHSVDKTPTYAPVGYPLPTVHALLLDEDDKPVPRGVPGRLHVITPALALGYLGDPVKTSDRFRQVPPLIHEVLHNVRSNLKPSALLFNSGDVGRILPDGQLGLLGRGDDTVKLRGYKVGIPFVESTLNGIDGVATVVVLPVLDDASHQPDFLVAYIVGTEGKPSEELLAATSQASRELLPPYAVPRDFIGLELLPLKEGESRKLDKQALPVPPSLIKKRERRGASDVEGNQDGAFRGDEKEKAEKHEATRSRRKPTNRVEHITRAWMETLHLDYDEDEIGACAVKRTDNFFDVGGNSLLASELIGRLSTEYGLPLSVLDLYEHSSLEGLIGYCQDLSNKQITSNHPKTSTVSSLRHRRRKFRSPTSYSGKVAIIGMSGKFPGAATLDEFWENICSGKDSLRTFTKAELAAHGLPPEVYNNPKWIPVGQVLEDADKFDAAFWDISPREAKMMDPQHRVFLEVAWSAMEDAGYPPRSSPDGPRTGVWAACGIDGYLVHHLKGGGLTTPLDPAKLFLTEIGNEKDYISTRVSYSLDLGGPSMTVTSACSSGLVAVAQAAQSLMTGQIDVAIAGASSLTFPNLGYCYEEGMVGSLDGHVRPFDEKASGTLFGDGVGAVVLKRLEDAVEDGDHILSLLTGFDITNDGRQKAGYAAPSASAQAAAIVGAMDMAGVSSEQISYIECHATATHVGDAIELRGLSQAFEANSEGQGNLYRCALGSIKGNIGHANCAAGISGLLKVVLMMKNRLIAPTANFSKPNTKLDEFLDHESSPFYINRKLNTWTVIGEQLPRRAGVSSFGIGGTNAHVVLEEYPNIDPGQEDTCNFDQNNEEETIYDNSDVYILPVTAKTPEALKRNIANLATHLEHLVDFHKNSTGIAIPSLRNIAYTLQCGREAFSIRSSVVVRSHEEAISALRNVASSGMALQNQTASSGGSSKGSYHTEPASVVMFFPGQGSHYSGMARALYNDCRGVGRFFRQNIDRVFAKFKPHLEFDLRDAVFARDKDSFANPAVAQPAIFAVELALAQTLMELGVRPVAVAGHSIGEYVAATVSGVLTVEDAAMLVAERAKATAEIATGEGSMLFAKLSPEKVDAVVEEHADMSLAVAAINGPEHVVISGSTQAIGVLAESLESDGIMCRLLKVSHAFHSEMMSPVAARLVQCAESIKVGIPCIPLTSNVTGRWISGGSDHEMSDPQYWAQQVVGTVRWKDNVDAVLRWSPAAAVEVGPGNTLISLLSKCMAKSPVQILTKRLACLPHATDDAMDDCFVFNRLLADLWYEKVDIDWALYNRGPQAGEVRSKNCPPVRQRVTLPSYAFEKTSFWTNPEASIYVTPNEQLASVYRVVWRPFDAIPANSARKESTAVAPLTLKLGTHRVAVSDAVISAAKSPYGVVLVMQCPLDFRQSYEIDVGWSLLRFVQDLTVHTTTGRVTMICPACHVGSVSVGASRSVAQEYPDLKLMRFFLPIQRFDRVQGLSVPCSSSTLEMLLDACRGQTDVLLPDGLVTDGRILSQAVSPMQLSNPNPAPRNPCSVFEIKGEDGGDQREGIYLFTGGTGALGQALVGRLVSQHRVPQENIVLLSRGVHTKGNAYPGIRMIQVDFSDPVQLKRSTELHTIKKVAGIFHLAGCLDDAVVINQTRERVSKVVAPKAAITTLLEIVKERNWEPKFVLMYSSTTSLLGHAGQSNYGAANAILDQMANTWDKSNNEVTASAPIIAVNWGSWGEVGMAAEGTKAHDTSIKLGDMPMSTEAAIGALEALFANLFASPSIPRGQFTINGINWATSPWRKHPIVRDIVPERDEHVHVVSLAPSTPSSIDIEEALSNHISRWDPKETLVALGLDSLDMLQLVTDLSNKFAVDIKLQDVIRSGHTLGDLVDHIARLMEMKSAASEAT